MNDSLKSNSYDSDGSNSSRSSPLPNTVIGKDQKGKKGLGAKKVSSDFFADFDLADDEEVEDPVPKKDEPKGYSSRLNYDEDKPNKSSASTTVNPEVRVARASVTSDSFVPSRSKAVIQAEKKETGFGYAQQNFGRAKAISSTQFFGEDDKNDDSEKKTRLSRFEGATSISSAVYYDRNEDDMGPGPDAGDIARRLAYTAKTDLSHVKDILSESGSKLKDMASTFISEMNNRYN